MKQYKFILIVTGGLGITLITMALYYAWRVAEICVAYKARRVCSSVFVSGRDIQAVLDTEVCVDDLSSLRYITSRVDYQEQSVTAQFLGIITRKAIYRAGLGCTLAAGGLANPSVEQEPQALPSKKQRFKTHPWPAGDSLDTRPLPREVDKLRLESALNWAFAEPDSGPLRRTRAAVVVYKGRIVGERYAPGIRPDTPLIGWSMSKSVVNALIGVLVEKKRLSLDSPAPVPEWQRPGDPRRQITISHLLHMTSGLKFDESPGHPLSDVTYMLLGAADTASFAASKPLVAVPGEKWSYSSGNTNILSRVIRHIIGDQEYYKFPYRALFDRVGMNSAVMETDPSGTFIGSSFTYASARDWARFGLLYLYDGVWDGERIIPEGWVRYSRTATPASPRQEYGAHFWLKIPKEYCGVNKESSLPEDAFHAAGHEGQFVTIIPSKDLVIVRLGLTRYPEAWDHQTFVKLVIAAVSQQIPEAGDLAEKIRSSYN